MRFLRNAAALGAGLMSLLASDRARQHSPRPAEGEGGRRARLEIRCAAMALAFALGLNGIGLCLCAPLSVKGGCEPQGCCPDPGGHHDGTPEAGTSLKASSAPCRASQVMSSGVADRIDDRDVLRHTLTAAAALHVSPAHRVAASVFGASASPLHSSSPARTAVLRI